MKIRTCPHCGYQYSRIDYVKKLFFKFIWSKWSCLKCGQEITFDIKRRFFVAISFALWLLTVNIVKNYFTMDLILWVLVVIILSLGSLFIFTFDNFTKTHKHGEK